MDMDEIVNGSQEPKVDAEVVEQAAEPVEQAEERAPTAPANESREVPLAALEAERKQRQDWKERAIRAEEQLNQRQQQPQRQEPTDPLQSMHQQIVTERFNTSEMILRGRLNNDADVDAKVDVFMEAARANPALNAALHQQRDPWGFAYKEGQKMLMLREVGDDPAAYRAKVEAEVRASLSKPAAPEVNLPTSLATARSTAPRSAPGFSGPTPLDQIVNTR